MSNLPTFLISECPTPSSAASAGLSDESSRPKRFRVVSEEELDQLFDGRHSNSTKKNTLWGLKLFQEWNIEVSGRPLDMTTVSVPDLAELLRKFYCGARPYKSNAEPYTSNTLVNVRGALNRHLTNIHRTIDIVRDKEFKHANGILDGLRKQRNLSKAVHTTFIETEDLQQIFTYLRTAWSSPIILRQCVWFNLSMYFVTRGMEFHEQLTPQSFLFQQDEYGEYVTLTHDIVEEIRGCAKKLQNDKRMYSCPESPSCPVKMLKLLLKKTDSRATSLFNQYSKESSMSPMTTSIWYTPKPLSKRTFARFLTQICKAANVDENYTPLCLRATAMQYVNGPRLDPRERGEQIN